MELSVNVSSQTTKDFERLIGFMSSLVQKEYCRRLAREYGLTVEDAEDIHAIGAKKLWSTYFSPTSTCRYQKKSDVQDGNLVRKILHDAAVEHSRFIRRCEASSLDAPLYGEGDFVLGDLGLLSEFEDYDIRLIALEAIEEVCRKSRSEGPRLVARYLLGEIARDELVGYDDNYIRVYKHRFWEAVRHALSAAHDS